MKKNVFLKGAILLIICNLIGKVFGAVYRIPLAKILGPVGMGMYQLVFPIYCLILTISTSGMPVAISKLVAENNSRHNYSSSKKIFKISILFLTLASLLGALIVVFSAKLSSNVQGNQSIFICYYGIAPAILFVGVLSAFRGYFQGNLLMFPTAISSLVENIIKMVMGLMLAGRFLEFGIEYAVLGALLGVSASEFVASIFLWVCYLFFKGRRLKNESQNNESFKYLSKQIMNLAVPVTLGSLIAPMTSMVDSLLAINLLMVTGFSSKSATTLLGLQSGVVEPLINIPVIIAVSIAMVLLPNISKFNAENDHEKIKNYAEDVIITSIEEEILDNVSDSDFLVESYDSQGKVSYAYFDTQKINLVRNTIAKYMDNIINRIEHHQDLQKIDIPIAYFLGTKYFLSNSFKIPISLEVVGNQDIDIKTEKIVSGLNTTIFEINLVIAVEIYVVIPFQSKKIETSTQIPIAIEILNNEIPYYYSDKQV